MTAFILHGFQRFILAAKEDTKLDIIPVDHVVNLIIAAAWNTGTARKMYKYKHLAGFDSIVLKFNVNFVLKTQGAGTICDLQLLLRWE